MRPSAATDFDAQIQMDRGVAHLSVDALKQTGEFLSDLESEFTVTGPGGLSQKMSVVQTSPGQYESVFPVSRPGVYLAHAAQKRGGRVVYEAAKGLAVSYPTEYRFRQVDEALLKDLAAVSHGQFCPGIEDLFRQPEVATRGQRHLWQPLLWVVACLLVLDIALRRWSQGQR